jgi:hypothetical protein
MALKNHLQPGAADPVVRPAGSENSAPVSKQGQNQSRNSSSNSKDEA